VGAAARALSSLTVRGRCLIGGGAALLLVGLLLGERALTQMAVFVLALPLLAAAVVARERFRLTARRTVTPARVPRGGTADVLLEIVNADLHQGGLWLLTEQVPAELGRSPRFVIDRLGAGATAAFRYRVHGEHRGRHVLGPVRLRLVDPFGLVERSALGTDSAPLLVVPRVLPLGDGDPTTGHGAGGEGARRSIAVHGEDDVSTRAYRHGDDLRKVNWRATARTGVLMVRLEERPWRAQATLFLDTRSRAHLLATRATGAAAGSPSGDRSAPPDSLEWLIEAAASIGTSLAHRGAQLRAVTDTGELTPVAGRGRLGPDDLLERLAGVGPSRVSGLGPGVDRLCRVAGEGPVVCLLGAVGPDDVVDLIRGRSGPTTDLAVLVDIGSWADAGLARGRRGMSAAARATLAGQRDDAVKLLRASGWQVAVAGAGQSVTDVWAELRGPAGSPQPAVIPAGRATWGTPV
jgi:uncharacterized protein (DUF58 family)